jgi:formiminoglutamase
MSDLRLRELIETISPESIESIPEHSVVILSYPDDEGIRNNGGRVGAKEGPSKILSYLSRLCQRTDSPIHKIYSVALEAEDFCRPSILKRYEMAQAWSQHVFQKQCRIVSLGGGHDYGYPDGASFFQAGGTHLINVDAHLDVRPFDANNPNSGNAFFRLLEEFPKANLIQWGIQIQAAADEHLQYCREKKVQILSRHEDFPKKFKKKRMGLSICLDAIAGVRGVSAPALVGLSAEKVLELVQFYSQDALYLGLYESAPLLDPSTEDSARLAALFAYHYIYGKSADESRLYFS